MNDAEIALKGAHIAAIVLRPDPERGLYRGARFVHAGIAGRFKALGHVFCTPWNPEPGPLSHDGNAIGTAGEFRVPLGYDDAAPGEGFVKVGVGVLERDGDGPYRFSHPYRLLDPGAWRIEADAHRLRCVQTLDGPRGIGYRLEVTLALDPDRPGFTLAHALTNTGHVPIVTDHYDHHFFNVDDHPTGPDTTLTFPFTAAARASPGHGAAFDGRTLRLPAPLAPGTWIGAHVDGWGDDPVHNGATFTDHAAGASVSFVGDRPLSGYYMWGMARCLCPEPYIAVALDPGQTLRWSEIFVFEAP